MNLVEVPLYGSRTRGGQHGTVSTKHSVVAAMLDMVGYVAENNLSGQRLLDPAGGNGVFILEAIRRLSASANQHGFCFAEAYTKLCVVEIDLKSIGLLRKVIDTCLDELNRSDEIADPGIILLHDDFLRTSLGAFDIVVGNPPYVRYDNIPAEARDHYKQKYRTFSHRADLYIPFFEKALRSLTSSGRLCYLCANRWMKNSYGQGLRGLIARGYTLSAVIDLENAAPFEENVSAYPAIALIENRWSDDPIRWSVVDDIEQLTTDSLVFTLLPRPQSNDWQQNFRKETRSQTMQSIQEQGFKIGIGVATGADRVFIGKHLDVEKSRLLPLLTSRDLRGNQLTWAGQYILNPFETDGRLINLEEYPRLAHYLIMHEEVLRQRHVAQKNPAAWYRTIDRIYPELTAQPKLLLPDMSANHRFLLDEGHYYPHHNLYYITGPDITTLKVLGALLMTTSVKNQFAQLSTRMNGGYLRWQSQHLRKLILPSINRFSSEEIEEYTQQFDAGF